MEGQMKNYFEQMLKDLDLQTKNPDKTIKALMEIFKEGEKGAVLAREGMGLDSILIEGMAQNPQIKDDLINVLLLSEKDFENLLFADNRENRKDFGGYSRLADILRMLEVVHYGAKEKNISNTDKILLSRRAEKIKKGEFNNSPLLIKILQYCMNMDSSLFSEEDINNAEKSYTTLIKPKEGDERHINSIKNAFGKLRSALNKTNG